VKFVGYIEDQFAWRPGGPITEPWIGFWHNPPNQPHQFGRRQSPEAILRTSLWRQSQNSCVGIFTLSRYMADWLSTRIDAEVEALVHPTATPDVLFSLDRYRANPSPAVVHVGWWLRRFPSFYRLPVHGHRKILLDAGEPSMRRIHDKQMRWTRASTRAGVIEQRWLEPAAYDQLLTENIVFLHLYDSSANNTVVECIVRETPILVNPLPAVVEYLGADYPLYFESLDEAAAKTESADAVAAAHAYLRALHKDKFTSESFRESLLSSSIGQALARYNG